MFIALLGAASMSRVVLVVDDEPLVLDVTASMLEDLGCEVVTAAGASDAKFRPRRGRAWFNLFNDKANCGAATAVGVRMTSPTYR
jgi:hypothetical protein